MEKSNLIQQILILKKENFELYFENQRLHEEIEKLKQRTANSETEHEKSETGVYEVEKLVNHRGRKGNREFKVRWKGFDSKGDTWEKQSGLACPDILEKYLKKHKLS